MQSKRCPDCIHHSVCRIVMFEEARHFHDKASVDLPAELEQLWRFAAERCVHWESKGLAFGIAG